MLTIPNYSISSTTSTINGCAEHLCGMSSRSPTERTITVKVTVRSLTLSNSKRGDDVLGYNNRFRKRLQKSHPCIWLLVDAIRSKVDIVHDIIVQIGTGTEPREKRPKTRIAERRMEVLYRRFENDQITPRSLLRGLSLFEALKNKKVRSVT